MTPLTELGSAQYLGFAGGLLDLGTDREEVAAADTCVRVAADAARVFGVDLEPRAHRVLSRIRRRVVNRAAQQQAQSRHVDTLALMGSLPVGRWLDAAQ